MIKSRTYFLSSLEKTIQLPETGFGASTLPGEACLGKYDFAWFHSPLVIASTCNKHWTTCLSAQFDETRSIENPNLGAIVS